MVNKLFAIAIKFDGDLDFDDAVFDVRPQGGESDGLVGEDGAVEAAVEVRVEQLQRRLGRDDLHHDVRLV